MLNTVLVPCTECGDPIEFQSKAGDCDLKTYHYKAVPPEIAIDLDGQSKYCKSCFATISLHYDREPLVSMRRIG